MSLPKGHMRIAQRVSSSPWQCEAQKVLSTISPRDLNGSAAASILNSRSSVIYADEFAEVCFDPDACVFTDSIGIATPLPRVWIEAFRSEDVSVRNGNSEDLRGCRMYESIAVDARPLDSREWSALVRKFHSIGLDGKPKKSSFALISLIACTLAWLASIEDADDEGPPAVDLSTVDIPNLPAIFPAGRKPIVGTCYRDFTIEADSPLRPKEARVVDLLNTTSFGAQAIFVMFPDIDWRPFSISRSGEVFRWYQKTISQFYHLLNTEAEPCPAFVSESGIGVADPDQAFAMPTVVVGVPRGCEAQTAINPHTECVEMTALPCARLFSIAVSIMNCANIHLVESGDLHNHGPRQERRENRLSKPPQFVKYHTLRVRAGDRLVPVCVGDRQHREVSSPGRMHLVRGHFRRFDRPGSRAASSGRFHKTHTWVQPHIRGSSDAGLLVTDYEVKI